MEIADRVRRKSDKPGRALVIALCVAPVAAPLFAAGLNVFSSDRARSDAPVPVKVAAQPAPRLALRAALDLPGDPIFTPEPMSAVAQARLEPPRVVARVASVAPSVPQVQAPPQAPRPRLTGSHVLRNVAAVDGLRLDADGMRISLAGIGPVPAGSECKRLDGVVEPCEVRAANRLDILTRGRQVVCELQDGGGDETRGVCRAGKIDLADDLVRNGLALRTADGR